MKATRDIMGMPVSVEIVGPGAEESIEAVFDYFAYIDGVFSTYKPASEISRINRGELGWDEYSPDMKKVFELAERTRLETKGYFDIRRPDGSIDPSGLVKGWAINNAAAILRSRGMHDFCIEAGGDLQCSGSNKEGNEWSVGIRHPMRTSEIIKVVYPKTAGVATSGTYLRGPHIYDPHTGERVETEALSLTVIGPDIYEADRIATAAFAMGESGLRFVEELPGFEAYMVGRDGIATLTTGFNSYLHA